MTPRERFHAVLHFQKPDKMPMVEWAGWWNLTYDRWLREGLDSKIDYWQSFKYFGLENLICYAASPQPQFDHEGEAVRNEADYEELKKNGLYSDKWFDGAVNSMKEMKERHDRGEFSVRIWLDGFFWYPRKLLGIEPHLLSFYDQPDLLKQINEDLCEFNIRAINAMYEIDTPELVGIAEDMSYNHGAMLSEEHFDEFLLPYYKKLIPVIKQIPDMPVMVDSDGDITEMIPWLKRAGIEGVYPLEHQAGVDIAKIRQMYPDFLMMGGYDKMVMSKTEKEMRAEFERILPVIRSGGYIPSVDHQTPPEVSLENYKIYMRLFEEYAVKAVQ